MALSDVYLLIDTYGANHTFARPDPPGPVASVTAKAMQRRSQEIPLAGDVSQQDTQFYVRHGSLSTAAFPVPCLKGDRVIENGRTWVVKVVEELHDETGNTAAYRLWCRGH